MDYVLVGWAVALITIALYAARLLITGRRLSARVPPERRRWMNADD